MVLMEALEDGFLSSAASSPNTFDTGLASFLPASSLPWALRFVVAKGPSTVESGPGYLVQSNRDPQGLTGPNALCFFGLPSILRPRKTFSGLAQPSS